MTSYDFTSHYLTKNNEPWFPVMGEFHYSRYPQEYWRESLLKMKAGGVTVASSYIIWIHHEEIENDWDFEANKNLRQFVTTCGEVGLSLFLRIGPWVHAEVRNGGLPDWLLKKNFEARSNDDLYFLEVKKLYAKIYSQIQGLLLKDTEVFPQGGPIIGIQIENEYGHCGGLSGEAGEQHMQTLTRIARDVGFDVPLYTATGWGGAVTGGLIPVMGGYSEAPWDQRLTEIEPSGNYIFTHERNDHNIGSDFGFGTGITFDIKKFPYLTAELGGGLQVTKHRRPLATASDIAAMTLVKLGSGVNLLGYYMYHGGTNPKGKLTSLQESKETGSINDLPELSYDFKAPIREYGQLSDTYKELSLLTQFIADFGSDFCNTRARIPLDNPLFPTDFENLRYSFRENQEGSGFLFINNYQRHQKLKDHYNVSVPIPSFSKFDSFDFPPLDIPNASFFFLPYNMPIGDGLLQYALVSPLCILEQETPVYVFYASHPKAHDLLEQGKEHELYNFLEHPVNAKIVTLTKSQALQAKKIGSNLYIGDCDLYFDDDYIYCGKKQNARCFLAEILEQTSEKLVCQIDIPKWDADDCFLTIDYHGNTARLFMDDELIADNFFISPDEPWEIGLKRFGKGAEQSLRLEIEALYEGEKVYLEKWPPLVENCAIAVNKVFCTLYDVQKVSRKARSSNIDGLEII